jgi:hypothetical protein
MANQRKIGVDQSYFPVKFTVPSLSPTDAETLMEAAVKLGLEWRMGPADTSRDLIAVHSHTRYKKGAKVKWIAYTDGDEYEWSDVLKEEQEANKVGGVIPSWQAVMNVEERFERLHERVRQLPVDRVAVRMFDDKAVIVRIDRDQFEYLWIDPSSVASRGAVEMIDDDVLDHELRELHKAAHDRPYDDEDETGDDSTTGGGDD